MFASKTKRILVPVEGGTIDEESLALACVQAKRDRSAIVLLYIIEVRRNLPIDADLSAEREKGDRVLEELGQLAHRLGSRAQSDLLQAREAGPTIVGEAAERQVDLIVMGVPYREKFGAFQTEPRALYVLDHAPCRVCLVREPLRTH